MKDIQKEIEAVENVIRLLNEYIAICITHSRKEEIKTTLKDIAMCKLELKKLVAIKEKDLEAAKEKTKDEVQRSGTIFL